MCTQSRKKSFLTKHFSMSCIKRELQKFRSIISDRFSMTNVIICARKRKLGKKLRSRGGSFMNELMRRMFNIQFKVEKKVS